MIRAQIWLPEKWGSFFVEKKGACGNVPTSSGLPKSEGHFSGKKGACGNVPTSQGLPEIWGPSFVKKKKAPAATYPQVQGFQKFGPLGIQAEKQGFRTAWLITGQKFP